MPLFNCMFGAPHVGQYVAVRSKVGRTIGWLCALHFKNHEKALLSNGYHFRTIEELRARGELDEQGRSIEGGRESVAPASSPEQQQFSDDYTGGDTDEAGLAHERAFSHHAGGRSHGSATNGRHKGSGSERGNPRAEAPAQELETVAPGRTPQVTRPPDGTPATRERGELEWPAWCDGAGFLSLTEEQRATLQRPFGDNDITIRYDGIVYVPWRRYWARMVKAFAPFVPSIIPIDNPRFQGQEIIVGVVMVVEGRFVGKAWGSHRLEGANDRMAVGDRIESAISDAISKIGKRLDMGAQLWDDTFRDYWKSQYAESYTDRGRTYWRRKAVVQVEEHEDDSFNHYDRGA